MKKFIFSEKRFLSELYRNCPEHPKVVEILRNGEARKDKFAKKWKYIEEIELVNLQFAPVRELCPQEFVKLCRERDRKKRQDNKKRRSEGDV